jgi:hypothetical protein
MLYHSQVIQQHKHGRQTKRHYILDHLAIIVNPVNNLLMQTQHICDHRASALDSISGIDSAKENNLSTPNDPSMLSLKYAFTTLKCDALGTSYLTQLIADDHRTKYASTAVQL